MLKNLCARSDDDYSYRRDILNKLVNRVNQSLRLVVKLLVPVILRYKVEVTLF